MIAGKPVVLMTGSVGTLGSALSTALADAFTVVGIARECHTSSACIEADITSDQALSNACQTLRERHGDRIASVIHLAAFFDFSGESNPKYEQVNVRGTEKLIRALETFKVEQFVYASTMLVHAPTQPGVPINEDWPLEPKWAYPQSKVAAEDIVRHASDTMPTVMLRLAGVYTDDCQVPSLATQIQRIYERQMLSHVFPGDASHGQSFLSLADLIEVVRRVVERRAQLPAASTFLIGEPVTESYEALQNLFGRLIHGESWQTTSIAKTVAAAGSWLQGRAEDIIPDAIDRGIEPFIKPFMVDLADDHYELDISRAQSLLGWQPARSLRQTLPKMVEGLIHNPARWYKLNNLPPPPWVEVAHAAAAPGSQPIQDARALERREHQHTLWCHFTNAALGLWLATSPFIFGLADGWMVAGDLIAPNQRGLELSDTWMTASDTVTGLLIVVFALLSLSRDGGWARWITAVLGGWLLVAPLVLWTTSAAAYANDTLIGVLVIAFAIGVPTTPGINPLARVTGPEVPPGWSYNPSAWTSRLPIVILALVGLFVSRYLAAFQLGHIESVWDPFFRDGTERIITSSVSEAWPVSDSGLGATTYALEILVGVIGDRRRWRTMPWLTLLFGLLIVPLGAVSIYFIIIQPIVIGTWCSLCLLAAAAMLIQIPYSLDEILATLQFLRERRSQGRPLWYVFFHGGTMQGSGRDRSDDFEVGPGHVVGQMLHGGVTLPWTLALSVAIGVALMLTRVLFDASGAAANNDHLMGALVVTFSIIALAEVARPLRFVNVVLGAWLVLTPWVLTGYTMLSSSASVIAGILLILLALPRGPIRNHYGAWDRYIGMTPKAN
jgi:nucleoside-diphosphate-sugar epimerase